MSFAFSSHWVHFGKQAGMESIPPNYCRENLGLGILLGSWGRRNCGVWRSIVKNPTSLPILYV